MNIYKLLWFVLWNEKKFRFKEGLHGTEPYSNLVVPGRNKEHFMNPLSISAALVSVIYVRSSGSLHLLERIHIEWDLE